MNKLFNTPVIVSTDSANYNAIVIREGNGNILMALEGPTIAMGLSKDLIQKRATEITNMINQHAAIEANVANFMKQGKVPTIQDVFAAVLPLELKAMFDSLQDENVDPQPIPPLPIAEILKASIPADMKHMLANPHLMGFSSREEMVESMPPNLKKIVRMMDGIEKPEMRKTDSLSDIMRRIFNDPALKADNRMDESEAFGAQLHVADHITLSVVAAMLLVKDHSFTSDKGKDGTYIIKTCTCGYDLLLDRFGEAVGAGNFKVTEMTNEDIDNLRKAKEDFGGQH